MQTDVVHAGRQRHWGRRGDRAGFRTLLGAALIVAGIFWFVKTVGWIPVAATGSSIFWPAVVLVLGISMLFGVRNGKKNHVVNR